MIILKALVCWFRGGHTDLRLWGVDKKKGISFYFCGACKQTWEEYD